MNIRTPLLLVIAFGILSCSSVNNLLFPPTPTPTPTATPTPTPKPVLAGRWQVFVDWERDGSFVELTWEFRADHSIDFIPNSSNNTGAWELDGNQVTLQITGSSGFGAKYTGTLDGLAGTMEGTMTNDDGADGDWHADRAQ